MPASDTWILTRPRVALVACAGAAISFVLPWFFPPSPTIADSYALGFNNTLFYFAFGFLFVVPVFVMTYLTRSSLPSLHTAPPVPALPGFARLFRAAAILFFVVGAAWLILCHDALPGYGEAEYFLLKARLIEFGRHPYFDFEYQYGLALLYPIAWLHAAGLSNTLSVALVQLADQILGCLSLLYVARVLFGDARITAQTVFWTLASFTTLSLLAAGESYVLLRFAGPMAAVMFLSQRRDVPTVLEAAFPPLGFLAGWLISPELGIAAGVTLTVVVIARSPHKLLTAAGILILFLLLFWQVQAIRISLNTLAAYAGGALNLPVMPNIYILALMTSVFFATVYIARDPFEIPSADWALYLYSGICLRSALGRSDAGHVFYNSFGFILLTGKYLLLARPDRRFFNRFLLANGCLYSLCFLMIAGLAYGHIFAASVAKSLRNYLSPSVMQSVAAHWPRHYAADLAATPPWQMPSGVLASDLLLQSPSDLPDLDRYRLPYFTSMANSMTPAALNFLTRDLHQSPRIVVLRNFVSDDCGPGTAYNYKTVSLLVLFPMRLFPLRHDGSAIMGNFCSYIKSLTPLPGNPGDSFVILAPDLGGKSG